MSEFRDTLANVVADREVGAAEQCRNLDDGTYFAAEIEEIQDIELNTELGRDAREQMTIHVSDRNVAGKIKMSQKIAVQLYGQWQVCLVIRRQDNPASPQVDFGLMKLTEKDT